LPEKEKQQPIEDVIHIPDDIEVIIARELQRKASPEDRNRFFEWLTDVYRSHPDFNLSNFLRKRGFSHSDYTRVWRAYKRYTSKIHAPTGAIYRTALDDFANFAKKMWEEARDISLDILMGWSDKAKEMGYYNPEKKKIDMKRFIEDAVTFYIQYKYTIEDFEERYRDLEAYARMLQELLKPQIYRVIALRLYISFVNSMMVLQAKGLPVPEEYLLEVRNIVNKFLMSTAPQVQKIEGEMYE